MAATPLFSAPGETRAAATAGSSVLLIDASPQAHEEFRAYFQSLPVQLLHAYSGRQGLLMAQKHDPTLIILDNWLPDLDGISILRTLKDNPRLEAVPVMLMTSSEDEQLVTSAFRLGAADYLRKPICAEEARARVSAVLQTQMLLRKLRQQASHDSLTGLPNRSHLAERIQSALDMRQCAPEYHFAVLFFDFDRFKTINDSLGHEFGDMLLREIAARFSSNLRDRDAVSHDGSLQSTVARIGGDEFVVLLDGIASPEHAQDVADRLLDAFSESYIIDGREVFSTASIGIVTSDLGHKSVSDLLRDADTAMYEAKAAGRQRYAVFDESMRTRVEQRLTTERDLRKAIELDQFELVYQPILALGSGHVNAAEALLRWNHPGRGQVGPDAFLDVAEETGLIAGIGDWVLREACRQLASWRSAGVLENLRRINVNVSSQQLLVPKAAQKIDRIARTAGISLDQLGLEFSERAIGNEQGSVRRTLRELRELGAHIEVDDFGTRHSLLTSLRELPLTGLKISRSTVGSIGEGRELLAVLAAVIDLAHDLDIETVAVGIEDIEQLASFQALGCDFGQGFLFAKPMSAGEFAAADVHAGFSRS